MNPMNPMKPLKGKWARGIEPRMFCWVIKDRMAACERPGGYARNHRKVRRLEEIIWLQAQGFTMVVSLLDSPHNLHAYDEMSIPHMQVPLGVAGGDLTVLLPRLALGAAATVMFLVLLRESRRPPSPARSRPLAPDEAPGPAAGPGGRNQDGARS